MLKSFTSESKLRHFIILSLILNFVRFTKLAFKLQELTAVIGEVAEWLKAHAWKACIPQKGIGGSNPFLSALFYPVFTFSYASPLVWSIRPYLCPFGFEKCGYIAIFKKDYLK